MDTISKTPSYDLKVVIQDTGIKPELVVLVGMTLGTAASMLKLTEHLQEYDVPSGSGGRLFNRVPGLHQRIPSHFLGETISQTITSIENMLKYEVQPVDHIPPSQELRKFAEQFNDKLPSIESQAWQVLRKNNALFNYLNTANIQLQENIYASLYLGDINYLDHEITWMNNLLKNVNIPQELLATYLLDYNQAINNELGGDAAILVSWLQVAAKNLA